MARSRTVRTLLVGSLAMAVLGACQGPPPNVVPATVEGAVPAPGAPAAPPPAVPQASAALTGVADLGGQAVANASVAVFRLGEDTAIAQGSTDAEGRFALALPDLVPGLPLKVVVRDGERTLGALTASVPAAAYRAASTGALRVSLGTTTALLAFQPRLSAYSQLTAGSGQAGPELVAAFTRFADAVTAVEAALLTRPNVSGVLGALGETGEGELPRSAAAAMLDNSSELLNTVHEVVQSLNNLISRLVREHGTRGTIYLGSLTIGNQVYDAVFNSSSGSGDTSAPGAPGPDPEASPGSIQLDPASPARDATPVGAIAQDRSLAQFETVPFTGDTGHKDVRLAVADDRLWTFAGSIGNSYTFTPQVGPWQAAYQPHISWGMAPLGGHGLIVKDGDVYVLSGISRATSSEATAVVNRAAWNATSGTFDDYVYASELVTARVDASYELVGDRIYVIGGRAIDGTPIDTVEVATFTGPGTLSAFEVVPGLTLATARSGHASLVVRTGGQARYLLVAGGRTASESLASIEIAPIDPDDGTLGAFTSGGSLGAGRDRSSCRAIQVDHAVYIFSGMQYRSGSPAGTAMRLTDRAALNPVNGALGAFRPHGVTLRHAVSQYDVTVFGDRVMALSERGLESAAIR